MTSSTTITHRRRWAFIAGACCLGLLLLVALAEAQSHIVKPPVQAGSAEGSGGVSAWNSKDRQADFAERGRAADQAEKAEKTRLTNLAVAKAQALPFWQELVRRYSVTDPATGKFTAKSPRCEDALRGIAIIKCDLAAVGMAASGPDGRCHPIPADKLDQAWKDALAALTRFTDAYPNSPFAGDCYVREVDLALERFFDLKKAAAIADTGAPWIAAYEKSPTDTPRASASQPSIPQASIALWQTPPRGLDAAAVKFAVYDLRLRGVLTSYLSEDYDKAKQLLAANGPLELSNGPTDAQKLQKVGLYFLQKAIVAKKPVWKPEVIHASKTEQQRTAVKLADFYLKVIRPEKSIAIYERILNKDPAFAPTVPTLQVYACIQLARCYAYDRDKHDKALEVLQTLYKPELAGNPLIAEGLVWLGTWTYNFTQDPKKSMPHFQYVLKHFPDSPWAERALYFYCLDAVAAKDKAVAESVCKEFLAKYPRSAWAKHITSILKDQVAKLPSRERNGQ